MDQAQLMKEKGNACFAKQKYAAAVDFYTEAICFQSDVAAFYTNRALCYMHMEKWTLAQDDCRQAIELEPTNAKAHYLLGKSLSNASESTPGIEAFEKALELASQNPQKKSLKLDILQGLRLAKKLKWKATRATQSTRHGKVASLFNSIVEQSRTHQLKCDPASEREWVLPSFVPSSTMLSCSQVHSDHDLVLAHMMELLEAQTSSSLTQIPEYFLCPIGMDIMYDPVTTPNGVSYERKWIEEHITRSHIDPLTRESLRIGQLRPNVALRQAIEDFLNKNPWAYEQD
ncbi:hypothetical protein AeRB84_012686 [Aphanomyces euteiches]|nr:hypothetical protein AeRB84_012686 [Aphanomyces euteiches]